MSSVEAPRIIITQPSPMPPRKEGRVQRDMAEKVSAIEETSVSIPATTAVESSGEFNPCLDEDCKTEFQIQSNTKAEEPEEGNEPSGDIQNCTIKGRCLRYCRVWAQDIWLKCLLLFLVCLLPISISAIYMGAEYVDSCPVSRAIPVILFTMGCAGFITLTCSLVMTVYKLKCIPMESPICLMLVASGATATILLLLTETMIIGRLPASFEPQSLSYCDETLHKYAHIISWIGTASVFKAGFFYMCKIFLTFLSKARNLRRTNTE